MGILFSLLGALFSSSKDLVSKRLSFDVDGTVSAFASFAFALPYYILLLALLWALGLEDFSLTLPFLWLVVGRSMTDACAEWLKMSSFRYGDLSLVAPFLALSPVFLLVASPLITGDSISAQGAAGVAFVIGGNLLLLGAKYKDEERWGKIRPNLKGICLAAASSFFFCLNTCLDRLAVQRGSPAMSGFTMTLLAALLLAPPLARGGQGAALSLHAKPFLLRGFFETAFMVTKLSALQFLPAPYVDGIIKLSLLFSILGGRFVFKEEEFGSRLVAGGLVTVGVVLIGIASVNG